MQISNSFKFYYDSNCWNEDGTLNITADIDDDDEYFYEPNWELAFELKLFDAFYGDERQIEDQDWGTTLTDKVSIDRNLGTGKLEVTEFTPWARKYLPENFKIWKIQDVDFGSRMDVDDGTAMLTHFILTSFITCELTTKITT